MEKSIGKWPVRIVYRDSSGRVSRCLVSVYSVRKGKARVMDWTNRELRTLSVRRVLSAIPVIPRAC